MYVIVNTTSMTSSGTTTESTTVTSRPAPTTLEIFLPSSVLILMCGFGK